MMKRGSWEFFHPFLCCFVVLIKMGKLGALQYHVDTFTCLGLGQCRGAACLYSTPSTFCG
eukprot:13170720-Ditylum_brightwellii.AAC.1